MELSSKFLVVRVYNHSQYWLEDTLLHYSKFRDPYNTSTPCFFAIAYILGSIVAKHLNLTLIAEGNPILISQGNLLHPRMLRDVQVFGYTGRQQLNKVWERFYRNVSYKTHSKEMPEFVLTDPRFFNFALCSVLKRKSDSNWKFSIFTDPFDIWTWLVLSVFLLLVTVLVSQSKRRRIFHTFLSVLAALLDNEMSHITKSKLYVLWLFTTLLIFDFYSGAITSQIISPPQPAVMTHLDQLVKNNYSIIFPHKVIANVINFTTAKLVSMKRKDNNAISKFEIISKLLPNSRTVSFENGNQFINVFTTEKQSATLAWSGRAIWAATRGNDHISSENNISKGTKKTCLVGQEKIPAGEVFVGFTPPGSIMLAHIFRRLETSGIVNRWNQESSDLLYFSRVQDRIKFKALSNMFKKADSIERLRMTGKTVTIFLLWTLCLLCCCLTFAWEKVIASRTTKIVMFLRI